MRFLSWSGVLVLGGGAGRVGPVPSGGSDPVDGGVGGDAEHVGEDGGGDSSTIEVSDGLEVVLRPVVPEDKKLLEEGFERLSPESRYRRFFSPVPRLSEALLSYLTDLDYHDHFAWAALVRENGRDALAGVSRYGRLPEHPGSAEMAVTVIDPYQHRGIGTLLLDALVLRAIGAGISQLEGHVLAENRPM
ncbi:MAG: GNAT family N-acetyltransferase, partial [Acidimicrobiia bacterium]